MDVVLLGIVAFGLLCWVGAPAWMLWLTGGTYVAFFGGAALVYKLLRRAIQWNEDDPWDRRHTVPLVWTTSVIYYVVSWAGIITAIVLWLRS